MSDQQFLSTDPQAGLQKPPAAPPAEPEPSDERQSVSAVARVPAAGRGTQFTPNLPNRAVDFARTPLAHPTGIDAIDGLTSPIGIASTALGVGAIARAGLVDGAMGAVKTAVGQATPLLKYEATKSTLEHLHVPTPIAMAAAIAVSGYRGNGKHPPVPVAAEAAPAAEAAAIPAAAPSVAPPESVPAPTAPAAPVVPPSTPLPSPGPPPALPKLKLSDLTADEKQALQGLVAEGRSKSEVLAKIAELRATQPAIATAPPAPPPQSPIPAKPSLLAAEMPEFQRLLKSGKSMKEAMDLIQQQRELVQKLGLPSATEARASVVGRNATGRWPE